MGGSHWGCRRELKPKSIILACSHSRWLTTQNVPERRRFSDTDGPQRIISFKCGESDREPWRIATSTIEMNLDLTHPAGIENPSENEMSGLTNTESDNISFENEVPKLTISSGNILKRNYEDSEKNGTQCLYKNSDGEESLLSSTIWDVFAVQEHNGDPAIEALSTLRQPLAVQVPDQQSNEAAKTAWNSKSSHQHDHKVWQLQMASRCSATTVVLNLLHRRIMHLERSLGHANHQMRKADVAFDAPILFLAACQKWN